MSTPAAQVLLQYPAMLSPREDGGFLVAFRDIPEAVTRGGSEEEAIFRAAGVLFDAVESYREHGRVLPKPSQALPGERIVRIIVEN